MSRSAELSEDRKAHKVTDVVVGIVRDADDRILIGQRRDGTHMAGYWEFPGGKREAGESARAALGRELEEELGVRLESAEPLLTLSHTYPDREVCLDVWWVSAFGGEVHPRERQALRWVPASALDDETLLPADRPIVAAIRKKLASKAPAES